MAIEQIRESSVFAKTNAEPLSGSVGANIAKEIKETETNDAVDKAEFSSIKARLEEEQAKQEESEAKVEKHSISEVVEFLNSEMPMVKTSLIFEFDELNEPPIVKVIDKDNGETIREIPPKYLKEVSESLQDVANSLSSSGVLLDKKA